MNAHEALEQILDRNDRLETLLAILRRAWEDLDHQQRVELGQQHPRLVDALLRAAERVSA